jgi:hypothetical protein
MRIWGGTARRLGWATDDQYRIIGGVDKFAYPMAERFVTDVTPLAALYVLALEHSELAIAPLMGFGKFDMLLAGATYCRDFLDTPAARSWHFEEVCRLAEQVPAFTVGLPRGHGWLDEASSAIERHHRDRVRGR